MANNFDTFRPNFWLRQCVTPPKALLASAPTFDIKCHDNYDMSYPVSTAPEVTLLAQQSCKALMK